MEEYMKMIKRNYGMTDITKDMIEHGLKVSEEGHGEEGLQ